MNPRFCFCLLAALTLCVSFGDIDRADEPNPAPATTPAADYPCRWTETPITIDGKDDEPAWKNAQPIDDFKLWWLTGDARKPHTATQAKMLWDRDYLYFFARMEDHDLYANTTEHQGALWEGDVFELFLKPGDDKPGYYEFEVNPANATLELFMPSRNSGGWVKYRDTTHIELKTAVQLRGTLNQKGDRDKGWCVEGRIPWRDFSPTGGRPNPREIWKFAFCRGDVAVGRTSSELTSSAPLKRSAFHQYEDYSKVRFEGPEQASRVKQYGIDGKPALTTSRVVGSPDGPMPYGVSRVFPKLKLFQPIYLLEEPGTTNCLALQHLGNRSGPGRLVRFHNDADVESAATLLDVDGLAYGMTLHPDFLHNGYLYILTNGPMTGQRHDKIIRYTIDRQPPHALDVKSEKVILEWESGGHDGGDLAFGPDGYLYHAAGDGTSDSDANLRGQDLTHLNSAMIRIDVDHPEGDKAYSIPRDNPFLAIPGARPEIWAYGFRNPFRITFDRKNGNLWVGQNGQDLWEQVYLVHKGENYGWSVYEGGHPFNLNRKRGPTPIIPPTIDHPHSEMRSLIGGVVYYGSKLPGLQGAYIYGDWGTGRIWGVRHDGAKITWHKELARTTLQIGAFREMADGELIVIDQGGGFNRLEPAAVGTANAQFPKKLSETGLYLSTKDNTPDPALIPYDVNSPLWSDGAAKERFIALPPGGVMEATPTRGWNFPEGTVIVKTFALDTVPGNPASRRRIETRLLTKQIGQWVGYSYLWNDDQSDADLVGAEGADRPYTITDAKAEAGKRTQTWHYPSRAECMTCHSRASNFVLGLSTSQLNKDRDYGNGRIDNQLRVFEHLGVLKLDYMAHLKEIVQQQTPDRGLIESKDQRIGASTSLLPASPDLMPRLTNPADTHADLDLRARSYLHANCAICHIEAGGGNALMDLEYTSSSAKARIVNIAPQHDLFGLKNAKLIAPGHPESSVLLERMTRRGPGQMPPLASSLVDEFAVKLLKEWMSSE